MSFVEIKVSCDPELTPLLIAELSMLGFDVFEEQDAGFVTAVEREAYPEEEVAALFGRYQKGHPLTWTMRPVDKVNWNEEWEKNYDPVAVDDQVYVRATFHEPRADFPYEIVIHPRMSFGTGHHDTTALMLRHQLRLDHRGKRVYDFGTGTGILSIMAGLLGAEEILANDVDEWCIENAKENLTLNEIHATLLQGPVKELSLTTPADIVLANINKNILMEEMEEYVRLLSKGGNMLLSGFYEPDTPDLTARAQDLGLLLLDKDTKNNWSVLVFARPS